MKFHPFLMVSITMHESSNDRKVLVLFWVGLCAAACTYAQEPAISTGSRVMMPSSLSEGQTIEGLGAGQGVFVRNEEIYLYGDAETGVIRGFRLEKGERRLAPTDLNILLTRNGVDIAPHPTGLTQHPEHGTFLGDTVYQKGTIFHVDWKTMVREGNLDDAVLNMVSDDLARNGTRPEFVRFGNRWLVASSDYGDEGNQIRLYDPELLKKVTRTSSPGVLVRAWDSPPWVQTLHWIDEQELLVLVQNQIEGLRYRLTFVSLEDADELKIVAVRDFDQPLDELEGWGYLGDGTSLFLSSSRARNVWFGDLQFQQERTP